MLPIECTACGKRWTPIVTEYPSSTVVTDKCPVHPIDATPNKPFGNMNANVLAHDGWDLDTRIITVYFPVMPSNFPVAKTPMYRFTAVFDAEDHTALIQNLEILCKDVTIEQVVSTFEQDGTWDEIEIEAHTRVLRRVLSMRKGWMVSEWEPSYRYSYEEETMATNDKKRPREN